MLLDDAKRVMRVGQTKDLHVRAGQHRRHPLLGVYDFLVVYQTNDYAERRGLEQVHDRFNPPLDFARPINPKSPRRDKYLAAAARFLQGKGYGEP